VSIVRGINDAFHPKIGEGIFRLFLPEIAKVEFPARIEDLNG